MKTIELLMPLVLMALAFFLKLFIDRTITIPDTVSAILDLPADIAFFSLSVIVSFTIAKPDNRDDGMLLFTGFICMSLIVIFLWRRSLSSFASGNRLGPLFAGLLNYAITMTMATHAIKLVSGG